MMNKIKNLSIFIVAFSVMMIGASAASTLGSISPVFASTEDSNNDQSNSMINLTMINLTMINLTMINLTMINLVQVKQIMNNHH